MAKKIKFIVPILLLSIIITIITTLYSTNVFLFSKTNAYKEYSTKQSSILTIGSNCIENNTSIDEDVTFTYYVEINDKAYNGVATGIDGLSYDVVNGKISLPYNVTADITVLSGDKYKVKRELYDNDKYAIIDETDEITGVVQNRYYVTIDGDETEITEDEYNDQTNNEENTSITYYYDNDGMFYKENEVDKKTGYVINKSGLLGSTYSFSEYNGYGLKSSFSNYDIEYKINPTYSSEKKGFVTTYKYNGDITVTTDYSPLEINLSDSVNSSFTSHGTARSLFYSNVSNSVGELSYGVIGEINTATLKTAIIKNNIINELPSSDSGDWDKNEELTYSTQIYTFTEVYPQERTYHKDVEPNKTVIFDAEFSPAPTGYFAIDFIIYSGTLPEAYDGATFQITDSKGRVLKENEDYLLEVANSSLLNFGYTVYSFSNIKHGNYSIKQLNTKAGYTCDTTTYDFEIKRDGSVVGDNFSSSSFGSYIALTNNTYSFIKSYKVFKNNSFSIEFSKVDQNDEAVEGADFVMIERDATIELVKTLLLSSDFDQEYLNTVVEQIQSTDWNSIDVGTIIELILNVVKLNADNISEITIPAILTATSDSNGKVSFDNSSNVLNILGSITDSNITGEQLAEIIKTYFKDYVSDEYLSYLEELSNLKANIKVNTGMPHTNYILLEQKAPEGYARNPIVYTVKVNQDGTAVSKAGIVTPALIEVINEKYGVDLSEIIISEEEFNKLSSDIKNVFGTFDKYQESVIDTIVNLIGEYTDTSKLEQIKQTIHTLYEKYDDFQKAIEETLSDFNDITGDNVTIDWKVYDYRYFVDVKINVTDCKGNKIDNVAYIVTSENGYEYIPNEEGYVSVPYGTYKLSVSFENDNYLLLEHNVMEITIDDYLKEYAFEAKYHNTKKETITIKEATCEEDEIIQERIICFVCEEVLEILNTSTVENSTLGHLESNLVKENIIEPTCEKEGSYELVVYCERCHHEISREKIIIPIVANCNIEKKEDTKDQNDNRDSIFNKPTYFYSSNSKNNTKLDEDNSVTLADENNNYCPINKDDSLKINLKINNKNSEEEIKYTLSEDNEYELIISYIGDKDILNWTTNLEKLNYTNNVDYKVSYDKNNLIIKLVACEIKKELYKGTININVNVNEVTKKSSNFDIRWIIILPLLIVFVILVKKLKRK